jgi:hypothetical protein
MMALQPFDDAFVRMLALDDASMVNAVRNLERVLGAFAEAFGSFEVEVPTCTALSEAESRVHIFGHIATVRRLLGVRELMHLEDFVDGLRRHRVLSASLAGRAVIETAAAIVHVEERIASATRDLTDETARSLLDDLHRFSAGGRFEWLAHSNDAESRERLQLYAGGKEPEMPEALKAPNVLTMLNRLDRRFHSGLGDASNAGEPTGGVVRATYAMLSEFCHPASGTLILLARPSGRPHWIRLKTTVGPQEVRWFFWNMGTIIAPVAMIAEQAILGIARLADTWKP